MSRLRLPSILILQVLVLVAGGLGVTSGLPSIEPAQAVTQPNIIVVLTDDQPFDLIPQHPGVMPWVEGRITDPDDHWTRFDNAFVNTPMCCPARATMLTGQYSHVTGVQSNEPAQWKAAFGTGTTSLATSLRTAGYRTGLFGKYFNEYTMPADGHVPPGWDRFVAHDGITGFYFNYDVHDQSVRVHHGTAPEDYSTDVYGGEAVEFIQSTPVDTPFFAYFNPVAPHEPATPAPRHDGLPALPHDLRDDPNFNEADVSDKPAWVRNRGLAGATVIANENELWQDMYRSLRAVDEQMQDMVEAVEARGQLDNTVIVFMTDNGFSLRHHRLHGKACAYDACTRTPLFVRLPGRPGNQVRSQIVSNIDIAPTLAQLGGATLSKPPDGRSLVPLIDDNATAWRSSVLLRWGGSQWVPNWWAARSLQYLYVEYDAGGEKELYDVVADPFMLQNRAGQAAYAAAQSSMAATLASLKSGGSTDTTKPTISITTPAASATYTQSQVVNAQYSCADEAGGSGLASCVGTVPNGSAINTSTTGTKTFTVTARDVAGNQRTASRTYTVTSTSHSITITKSGAGKGSVRSSDGLIVCGSDCAQTYSTPKTITLTATPASGSRFVRWTGSVPAGCTTQRTCTLTVQGSMTVNARFAPV